MVGISTLKYLATQKTRDAEALLRSNRNCATVYLMGYALEYSLKRKICHTLNFKNGFPESNAELQIYIRTLAATPPYFVLPFTQVKEIRNHDLSKLLMYSGAEARIKSLYFNEWQVVVLWNPENRYKIQRYSNNKAEEFIRCAKIIIGELI